MYSVYIRGGARVFAWGGGGGQIVSLRREPNKICASPEKVAQWGGGGGGGTPTHFFSDFKYFFHKFFHNGVGVLSWS